MLPGARKAIISIYRGLLVSVRMMLVVLDPPGLKGEDNGCKHEGANNVFHKLVLAEGAMAAIVANNKPLHIYKVNNQC